MHRTETDTSKNENDKVRFQTFGVLFFLRGAIPPHVSILSFIKY